MDEERNINICLFFSQIFNILTLYVQNIHEFHIPHLLWYWYNSETTVLLKYLIDRVYITIKYWIRSIVYNTDIQWDKLKIYQNCKFNPLHYNGESHHNDVHWQKLRVWRVKVVTLLQQISKYFFIIT